MIKVSFLGDIMCEPLMLKAAKGKDGGYDFSDVFNQVRGFLAESDYVIGNLETPLAGNDARYVHELFSFNAPDEFAIAIKDAGVNFVSTSNNHCMDRGLKGLQRTVRTLDGIGLCHDGTHENPGTHEPFIATVKDSRIAVIPYTYGTNYSMHHHAVPDNGYIDLLHADTDPVYVLRKKSIYGRFKKFVLRPLKMEQIIAIKKTLGMKYNSPRKDDFLNVSDAAPFFEALKAKINRAKEQADIVVFYPHIGGQFNKEPGRFTEYTFSKALQYGVDAIIASHPHIVQHAEKKGNVPVFYSIGNFSMSPNSVYLLHENLPEYGLIVHLYIEKSKIVQTTFSIIKIVEEQGKILTVYPVDKYESIARSFNQIEKLNSDIEQIYFTVTGRKISGETVIRKEYELK